ncbi:MAG: ATP-binding protein [Bdellovibrionales bacterium]
MKFKFWAFVFISVCFPLLVICASGIYFIQSYEYQQKQTLVKQSIQKSQKVYFKSLDSQFLKLEQKLQKTLKERSIKTSSPFLALMVWDRSRKKIVQKYFLRGLSKTSSARRVSSFVKSFDEPLPSSFEFDTLFLKKKKIPVVILKGQEIPALKNNRYLVFGFLKDPYFFKRQTVFSKNKDKKIFLVNRQGRLLFHNNSKHLFKVLPQKSIVRKSIKKFNSQKNPYQLLLSSYGGQKKGTDFISKWKKKDKKELTFIQEWQGKGAFLVSRQDLDFPLFVFNSWALKWSVVCLSLFFLCFFGLVFTISPLFSAYSYLKTSFISLASTGEMPYLREGLKNPFLYFCKNRSQQLASLSKKAETPIKDIPKNRTFQGLLREEVKKLKFKYPGLKVIEKLETNVKLFGFESFMRILLYELLLNAIESMGAKDTQNILVSSSEKEDQFVFSVKDAGNGLLEGDRSKVFELYYSTKSQLGVGLNLVHSIVNSNNGKIQFVSSPQSRGLEVIVNLPLSCFLKLTAQKRGRPMDLFASFEAEESGRSLR